jgi:microtubule-associated protein tau
MNKVKVGTTSSPNVVQVKSKVGSLDNSTHRAAGGNVKIENRKLEWKAAGRTNAKNEHYTPKGGDKKVIKSHCGKND